MFFLWHVRCYVFIQSSAWNGLFFFSCANNIMIYRTPPIKSIHNYTCLWFLWLSWLTKQNDLCISIRRRNFLARVLRVDISSQWLVINWTDFFFIIKGNRMTPTRIVYFIHANHRLFVITVWTSGHENKHQDKSIWCSIFLHCATHASLCLIKRQREQNSQKHTHTQKKKAWKLESVIKAPYLMCFCVPQIDVAFVFTQRDEKRNSRQIPIWPFQVVQVLQQQRSCFVDTFVHTLRCMIENCKQGSSDVVMAKYECDNVVLGKESTVSSTNSSNFDTQCAAIPD